MKIIITDHIVHTSAVYSILENRKSKFPEIVVVKEKDSSINPDSLKVKNDIQEKEYLITSLPKFDEPFYQKRKHSPKGHQRPFKFHK